MRAILSGENSCYPTHAKKPPFRSSPDPKTLLATSGDGKPARENSTPPYSNVVATKTSRPNTRRTVSADTMPLNPVIRNPPHVKERLIPSPPVTTPSALEPSRNKAPDTENGDAENPANRSTVLLVEDNPINLKVSRCIFD